MFPKSYSASFLQGKKYGVALFADSRTKSKKKTLKATGREAKSFKTQTQNEKQLALFHRHQNPNLQSHQKKKKRKNSNDNRERLDKFDLVLHQHYYEVNAIGSSMQKVVYLVMKTIGMKKAIRKEEITLLDT